MCFYVASTSKVIFGVSFFELDQMLHYSDINIDLFSDGGSNDPVYVSESILISQ